MAATHSIDTGYAMHTHDAIVIGSEQAGPFPAARLARSRLKVARVEPETHGGTCVSSGIRIVVSCDAGGRGHEFTAIHLLAAVDRRPDADNLGLRSAGIARDRRVGRSEAQVRAMVGLALVGTRRGAVRRAHPPRRQRADPDSAAALRSTSAAGTVNTLTGTYFPPALRSNGVRP